MLAVPALGLGAPGDNGVKIDLCRIKTALVLWYSQTQNTERIGRLAARALELQGIETDAFEIREAGIPVFEKYDLIVFGSPVFHYDVPEIVQDKIRETNRIDNIPVSAFVTSGGGGGNQINTAVRILSFLQEKGGIPIGFEVFYNFGTFPPSWAFMDEEDRRKIQILPDANTFEKVQAFSARIVDNARAGIGYEINLACGLGEVKRLFLNTGTSKLMTGTHGINLKNCIGCGICLEKCPAGAIDLSTGTIDAKKCVSCMGCINNCRNKAVDMVFIGQKLTGYYDLVKTSNIRLPDPGELLTDI